MNDRYQIAEYNTTAAALEILRGKYSGPFDVTTTQGMDAARKARADVKGYRVALEKLRVELKAPALERTRLIDAEAKRITAELLVIEEPIDRAIKVEEQRREEEKAAKARAEAARLAAIAARISRIRNQVGGVANQPATVIGAALAQAQALALAPDEFQEFMPDALAALEETRNALQAALDARIAYEAEEARLRAEREAEEARLQAAREELDRLRAAEAARRAEEDRRAEEARLAREAEEARLQAAREAMERQRAELEARQREIEKKTAKIARKGKADPIADLKKEINADPPMAKALDEAYQRGFQAGLNSAQQAA
jgi:colicin import membrane protein